MEELVQVEGTLESSGELKGKLFGGGVLQTNRNLSEGVGRDQSYQAPSIE